MLQTMTIYVKLLDENVDVWRPVLASQETANKFKILNRPDDETGNTENLEFEIGAVVTCENRLLEGKPVLVAVQLVERL